MKNEEHFKKFYFDEGVNYCVNKIEAVQVLLSELLITEALKEDADNEMAKMFQGEYQILEILKKEILSENK